MDDDITNGYGHNSKHHWITFKMAYESTYTNLGEHINAEQEIERLRMEQGDLDTYIATFNKLMALAEYTNTEWGALNLFKKGLPAPLNISIIQNMNPIPLNLEGWQKAIQEQQLKYLQTHKFIKKNLSDKQKAFTKHLGLNNNQGCRDLNVMDVDLGQGTPRFTKLMEEEKAALMKHGAYFRCC